MGAWRVSLPARSNCANRGFAGTTVPGHFAPAGPVLGASARARSRPAHLVRTGPFAFAWAAQVLGHFPRPVLGHLAQPVLGHLVRAEPVPVYLPRLPKLGIA